MRRAELEHLIRAAAAVTDEYELVIIGSQSILGTVEVADGVLQESQEADMYPLMHPERADLIDGAIGEESPFHRTFGYYAQGVGPDTAVLPQGWQARLVRIQGPATDLKVGLCLEVHDLAASKLIAGRPKDLPFVHAMFERGVIAPDVLEKRLAMLPVAMDRIASLQEKARRLAAAAAQGSGDRGNATG
ncbi:MAG: hypothetical protein QM674_10615 [Burkholderiaceae bacterium]